MNHRVAIRLETTRLLVLAAVASLVAVASSGSFNPFSVFGSGSMVGVIVESILLLLLATSLVHLLMLLGIGLMVRSVGHMPAEDVICYGCGNPLVQFMGSHGLPIRCPRCGTLWHNGPACYNKGMERARIVVPTYPCPRCRISAAEDRYVIEDWV